MSLLYRQHLKFSVIIPTSILLFFQNLLHHIHAFQNHHKHYTSPCIIQCHHHRKSDLPLRSSQYHFQLSFIIYFERLLQPSSSSVISESNFLPQSSIPKSLPTSLLLCFFLLTSVFSVLPSFLPHLTFIPFLFSSVYSFLLPLLPLFPPLSYSFRS